MIVNNFVKLNIHTYIDVGNGESETWKNDPMEPSIVLMSDINDCGVVEVEGEIEVPSEDSERRAFLKSLEGREWLQSHPEQKVWHTCVKIGVLY